MWTTIKYLENKDETKIFQDLKNELEKSGIIELMKKDEDHKSKWHLEGDIWSHTELVVKNSDDEIAPLSLFHDVGKVFIKTKNKKTGRYMYPGHWIYSGNIFREYLFKILKPTARAIVKENIFKLTRIIQLHHFYQFPKYIKENLWDIPDDFGIKQQQLLLKLHLADLKGRIVSEELKCEIERKIDETKMKLEQIEEKLNNERIEITRNVIGVKDGTELADTIKEMIDTDTKVIYIFPIGIPKSGKTTTFKQVVERLNIPALRFGFDDIRVRTITNGKKQFIDEVETTGEYEYIYSEFLKKKDINLGQELLKEMKKFIAQNKNSAPKLIWIDNTNLKIKYRRQLISQLPEKKNSKIIALFFTAPFFEIEKRKRKYEISKNWKQIMWNMYLNTELPFIAEGFNSIFVL